MPFCENCGNKVSETAKFCSNCGEKINIASSVLEIQPEEPQWSLEKFIEENPPNEKGIITCPRCLGKGIVEVEDIERLSMKLFWQPGECRYCEGVGLVNIKKTTAQSIADSGFTDVQRKNLETFATFIEDHQGAYSYYDDYNFDQYFGYLAKDYDLYLGDKIPDVKLNLFISRYQNNTGEKLKFDDVSEITPYMLFESPNSRENESILIAVLDKCEDWFDNGKIILIINNDSTSFYRALFIIEKIEQDNTKLKIQYYDSGAVKDVQFSFEKSKPVLSELVRFVEEYISRSDHNEDDLPDEDQDESPFKPKDRAGIR